MFSLEQTPQKKTKKISKEGQENFHDLSTNKLTKFKYFSLVKR